MVRFGARLIGPRAPLWAALAILMLAGASRSNALAAAAGTLRVSTTHDELIQGDGRCSLREAIAAVNSPGRRTDCGSASRTSNMIVLGPGRYVLSIPPARSDGNASGDLNLTAREPVTIAGAGPGSALIDAGRAHDRVITVAGGVRVSLTRLTITGGSAPGQGGNGGGIYSRGRLTVTASTISGNRAGPGGSGGGIFSSTGQLRLVNDTLAGNGADGGAGGALAVVDGPSLLRNDTVADNGPGGGLFVTAARRMDDMTLQNTIVTSSVGPGCVATPASAVVNGGHDLSYGDGICPGRRANPRLGPLKNYGGPTKTMVLEPGSAAIGRVPHRGAHCPATDQRGVRRPQGRGCDIGSYEYADPKITISAPFHGASYERGSVIRARFRCGEGGIASPITTCRATVAVGHRIPTGHLGRLRFAVTAVDRSGHRVRKAVHYRVWEYVNPLRLVSGLAPRRIDLGVDYGGSGPLLALGRARVTTASNTDDGPESCWAISCWPGGGIVVYRLLDGPFAGKYVYVAEHLTVTVRAGQIVRPGQRIATLYAGYPWSEWGWAAGPGPEALAMADGHRCTCSDPGGWSTIEGRNMNALLVRLGAPSGYLQSSVPDQSMPRGWPTWRR